MALHIPMLQYRALWLLHMNLCLGYDLCHCCRLSSVPNPKATISPYITGVWTLPLTVQCGPSSHTPKPLPLWISHCSRPWRIITPQSSHSSPSLHGCPGYPWLRPWSHHSPRPPHIRQQYHHQHKSSLKPDQVMRRIFLATISPMGGKEIKWFPEPLTLKMTIALTNTIAYLQLWSLMIPEIFVKADFSLWSGMETMLLGLPWDCECHTSPKHYPHIHPQVKAFPHKSQPVKTRSIVCSIICTGINERL